MLPEKFNCNELFSYISDNICSNPNDLLMKYSGKKLKFDLKFATTQILNRKKTIRKLSSFLSNERFLFPDLISAEQASDERVARFHASLICCEKNIVDLTAGLGVDSMVFASNGNPVTAIEINPLKAEVLRHNASILNLHNLNVINEDCQKFLEYHNDYADIYFIDPARRDELKRRTFAFSDCSPDITLFYRNIVESGATLMIKASPLLDIDAVKNQLDHICHIYIVGVKGECKELLIILNKDMNKSTMMTAVDLDDNGIISKFSVSESFKRLECAYVETNDITTGSYLYEPNACVMKLKASYALCNRFPGIMKVSPNTELYYSERLFSDFPGRIIKIDRILSSHDIKLLKGRKRSVVTRNYPMKPDELRKKIGVGEDPKNFIYAFKTGTKGRPIMIDGKRIEV